jgi:hypothetical protein
MDRISEMRVRKYAKICSKDFDSMKIGNMQKCAVNISKVKTPKYPRICSKDSESKNLEICKNLELKLNPGKIWS